VACRLVSNSTEQRFRYAEVREYVKEGGGMASSESMGDRINKTLIIVEREQETLRLTMLLTKIT